MKLFRRHKTKTEAKPEVISGVDPHHELRDQLKLIQSFWTLHALNHVYNHDAKYPFMQLEKDGGLAEASSDAIQQSKAMMKELQRVTQDTTPQILKTSFSLDNVLTSCQALHPDIQLNVSSGGIFIRGDKLLLLSILDSIIDSLRDQQSKPALIKISVKVDKKMNYTVITLSSGNCPLSKDFLYASMMPFSYAKEGVTPDVSLMMARHALRQLNGFIEVFETGEDEKASIAIKLKS